MTHFTQGRKNRSKKKFFKTNDVKNLKRTTDKENQTKYICCREILLFYRSIAKNHYILVQKRSAVFEVKVFEVKVQQIVA